MLREVLQQLPAGILLLACLIAFPGTGEASVQDGIEIEKVLTTTPEIRQGGKLTLILQVRSETDWQDLTAEFSIENSDGEQVALLASDFFSIEQTRGAIHRFNFHWADLEQSRSGDLRISLVRLRQHALDEEEPRAETIAEARKPLDLYVAPVSDPVERMFVGRENALWWTSEMGPVDTAIARENGLENCVMFGGTEPGWIRNDYLSRAGTDGLCYWEITGYAVRMLALEYERSGQREHLERAMKIADAVVRNIRQDDTAGFPSGSLPTFNHYDGRTGEWFRDKAMMFDHGQIVMGLLELSRIMKKRDVFTSQRKGYEQAAETIGRFMLAGSRQKNNRVPDHWPKNSEKVSDEIEQTSKVVIGFDLLAKLTGDDLFEQTARNHLDAMLKSSPGANRDHHGRSYMSYGFLRGFQDYGEKKFLDAAVEWTASVAGEFDEEGRLLPLEEYSVLPAQSQLIRNAALLWELTADAGYMQWADSSARYLSQSSEAWTYRQPLLKLGRYFREAGALYNNSPTDELCSWSTLFHVDAMYHYLRLKYGHIHVGPESHVSMIGPVNIMNFDDRLEVRLRGSPEENIGIHVSGRRPIRLVEIDRTPFAYHTEKTARLPSMKDVNKVVIHFGEQELPHLKTTNSLVDAATLTVNKGLHLVLRGKRGTSGRAHVHWPTEILHVTLDDRFLSADQWQWNASEQELVIDYKHDGTEQVIEIAPRW